MLVCARPFAELWQTRNELDRVPALASVGLLMFELLELQPVPPSSLPLYIICPNYQSVILACLLGDG